MLWRLLLVFAIAAPTIMFLQTPARACECEARIWSPADDLERSVFVFRGVVTSIGKTSDGGGRKIGFAVATVWKGSASSDTAVWTPDPVDQCGYPFDEGAEYVVYVYREVAWIPDFVSSCSRTALVEDAAADLAELGPGTTIGDPTPYDPADRTLLEQQIWVIPIVATLIVGALALVGFLMKRLGSRLG